MKSLRWLAAMGLILSIAYGARELRAVARLADDPFSIRAASTEKSDMAKIVSGQIRAIEGAAKLADGGEETPGAADAKTSPKVFAPRPDHVVMNDTRSAPGKIFASRSGATARAAAPGGAVIVDSDGRRLEITPPARPNQAAPLARPKMELPSLDDPHAGLAQRKTRAQALLLGSVLLAFALALWARRYKTV